MINPESLDLSVLPWLPLESRNKLPRKPVIYFAIDSLDQIQYIGRSIDPRSRWLTHPKLKDLQEIGGVRIAYLFVDEDLMTDIEMALIGWFNPPLNTVKPSANIPLPPRTSPMRVRRVQEIEIDGLEQKLIEARENSRKSLASICREVGITPVYWYKLVSGKQDSIPVETLTKLGDALDVQFEVAFD